MSDTRLFLLWFAETGCWKAICILKKIPSWILPLSIIDRYTPMLNNPCIDKHARWLSKYYLDSTRECEHSPRGRPPAVRDRYPALVNGQADASWNFVSFDKDNELPSDGSKSLPALLLTYKQWGLLALLKNQLQWGGHFQGFCYNMQAWKEVLFLVIKCLDSWALLTI